MRLLVFTQKVDSQDPILGFFCGWIEALAKKLDTIHVICLEEGEHNFPKNVIVYSLGKEQGGNKLEYIVHLFQHLYTISGQYDKVFVHMNPIYFVLCGWLWKMKGIKTYLWYVHRHIDLKLRIAVFFADKIFTSSKESMRLETSKVVYLGHGIDIDKFVNTSHVYTGEVLHIAHVGRISPIKHIEVLINAIFELKERSKSKITLFLYGDSVTKEDEEYKIQIINLIKEKKLTKDVVFKGWITQKEMSTSLKDIHVAVNLSPTGGMDKSVLESILLGIPVFVSNIAFKDFFAEYGDIYLYKYANVSDLVEKIYSYTYTAHNQYILDILSSKVRENFSLERLIEKMLGYMHETSR